jgi:hypothetical protein
MAALHGRRRTTGARAPWVHAYIYGDTRKTCDAPHLAFAAAFYVDLYSFVTNPNNMNTQFF